MLTVRNKSRIYNFKIEHSPEYIGVAESYYHTLLDKAECLKQLIFEAKNGQVVS